MAIDQIRRGPAYTAGPFTLREMVYPAGFRQPLHAHDYMGVTLLLAGSLRESAGRREEAAGALSIVVKPAGVEHADEVGPHGARTLQIAFDPGATDALAAGVLDDWRWLHGDPAVAPMLALLRMTRRRETLRSADVEDCVVDTIASLATRPRPLRDAPAWLRRVRQALDDDAGQTSVRELARDAGVHEVSLSRAFRSCFGCTISEYRRRIRLRRAAADVGFGTVSLSRVAHQSGYADHAHLCREFRRATGLQPSAFRALAAES